jgi:hypothetical protein
MALNVGKLLPRSYFGSQSICSCFFCLPRFVLALQASCDEAFDGRTGSGCALTQVDGDPVPRAEERGAHGTRRLALRAVHRFAEVGIGAALAECGGRVAGPKGAVAKLGIPRQTLDSKIANLNIHKWRFKNLTRYVQLLKASSFAPAITGQGARASS